MTASGEELVEVAHEALLRHWPKLQEWIDPRRGALLTIRQLQADTRTWREKQKNASYQWSHERVREAVAALHQVGPEVVLSDEERGFLGPIDPEDMLAELKRPETTHKRRLLIGERLDVLGEHPSRWGVGVDANGTPTVDWRPVPGATNGLDPVGPEYPYSKVEVRAIRPWGPFASPATPSPSPSIAPSSKRRTVGGIRRGGANDLYRRATGFGGTPTSSGASAIIRRSMSAGSTRWRSAAG